jgi:hypothetical protein
MYRVHAVGSRAGWPPEVVVVFASGSEARRFAEASRYLLDVFAMAVYDAHGDVSAALRGEDSASGVPDLAYEIAFAEMLDDADPPPSVVYGTASESDHREVTVLYATREEAERHAACSYFMITVVELPVRRSRHDGPVDIGVSQGIRRKPATE